MYNRYIPKPDGTYSRCKLPDSAPGKAPPPRQEVRPAAPPPPCPEPGNSPAMRPRQPRPKERKKEPEPEPDILTFLRQLLPRNFDSGDLLVVLLLLLMSGDCGEDQNTALLTLALYLFL